MKRTGIIIATVALVAIGLLAFASPNKTPNTPDSPEKPKNNYETMWKKVKENLEKDLPESAEKELAAIEKQAEKDNNSTQLLKTWLYRQNIMQRTVEEDPEQAFIQYIEEKVGKLDVVHDAMLHEEIAKAYAAYLDNNEWRINENLPIDGDLSKVEMKYWDKESFKTRINQHYDEALKPVEALKRPRPRILWLCMKTRITMRNTLNMRPLCSSLCFTAWPIITKVKPMPTKPRATPTSGGCLPTSL